MALERAAKRSGVAGGTPEGDDLDKVCLLLRSATGIDFSLYKLATVRRRIARRMALQKIASLSKYAQILKQDSREAQSLADDIFIHVTRFFRDPECFQALRKGVLEKFRAHRKDDDPLRIWVAGCSTGEEVYSIAMLLLEELGEPSGGTGIQIFATDIQESALERARSGFYSASAVSGVSPARLKQFFVESDHGYQIQKFVRDLCVFARHDLANDPPFSKLELVSCRNVFIYMGAGLQKRLLSTFHNALKPGGFLFLGSSECIGNASGAFAVADRRHSIFTRRPSPMATPGEHLHTLIADYETAQEEMRAANEEILSSNEELQITNQELEIAKQELQSSNEELTLLNDELQHRNHDLSVLTDDLSNLLVCVEIPVVVLDANMRVRRFTPVAGQLLNLIPGDVGRPFADIASALSILNWTGLFAEVKRHGQLIEREVTDRNGHSYSLRLRPYQTSGHTIDGVLVVLFDTDASTKALAEAEEARHLAIAAENLNVSVLDSLLANVAVLDSAGFIIATNESWNRFARENGDPPASCIGPSVHYLAVCERAAAEGDHDAQTALHGIQDVLAGCRASFQFEYPCHSSIEQRWFLMNASPLKGAKSGVVVTHTNISDRKMAEIALQTSEFTIRSLLASAPQAVIAVGADEKIVFVNGNVQNTFGYRADELMGQPLERLVPEPSRLRHGEYHRSYFLNPQSRPMGIGLTLEALRKDGTTFPAEIGLSAIETGQGKLAIAFVSDISERRRLEQEAKAHAAEVQALAASLLTAQEEERRRVSRELHDQICQQLASLAIDMGGLATAENLPEDAQSRLKVLKDRVVKASDETRHIAYELHSSVLDDLGLVASLEDLVKDYSRKTKSAVKFTHDSLPGALPREIGSCLYRVAQESLQNILKHAGAKHVTVALTVRKGKVAVTVKDDGVGFNFQTAKGRGGLGLIGMEERARQVNGTLSVASQPNRGTRLTLEVPWLVV